MAKEKTQHNTIILSILLAVMCLVLAGAIIVTKTRTTDCTSHSSDCGTTTSASVGNSVPTIGTVYVNTTGSLADDQGYASGTAISLTAGSTKTVHVVANVTDVNGVGATALSQGDLYVVAATLSKSGTTCDPGSSTPDNNNCYIGANQSSGSPASCSLTFSSSTVVKIDCSFNLQYYADATYTGVAGTEANSTWVANVFAMDTYQQAHSGVSAGTAVLPEIDSLVALSFPPTLDFGSTLTMGQLTTATAYTVTQFGNTAADAQVKGSGTGTVGHVGALTCTAGYIPVIAQKWATTSGGSYTMLTETNADTNLNVAVQTSDSTPVTTNLYWKLFVPVADVGGSCTGTTTFSAIAH